jgi:DNA binding domain, excisionase family
MEEKMLLKVKDVAGTLSLGRSQVYKLIATGELRSITIGRSRRIPRQALAEFLASLESASALALS